MIPIGVAPTCVGRPSVSWPKFTGWSPSTSFCGVDRSEHAGLVDVIR